MDFVAACYSDEDTAEKRRIAEANNVPSDSNKLSACTRSMLPQTNKPGKRRVKRKRDEQQWECNKRKEARNRGLSYISVRKKLIPAKTLKYSKDCRNKCTFKCSQKISDNEKLGIFTEYYKLSPGDKRMYILDNTTCLAPNMRRKGKTDENSKKKMVFNYFLTVRFQKIRVCKTFFCDTLAISQKPIYNIHKYCRQE